MAKKPFPQKNRPAPTQAENEPLPPAAPPQGARNWRPLAAAAGAAALFLLIYLLRLDRVYGLYVDDAYYVLLAKALAGGQGFTLINTPTPGIVPIYPPGFPALLSLAFRLSPQHPENVWLLKAVSVAAVFALGVLSYFYFTRLRAMRPPAALGLALGAVLSPGLVTLAASTTMSECVFACAQMLAVFVLERAARGGAWPRWAYAVLGAACASFAFLTRSIALGLIAAAVVYFVKEKAFTPLLVFAAGVALAVGPWMAYSRAHAPTPEQRQEQKGYILDGYATQFWQRQAGYASSGTITLKDVPLRVWNNAVTVTTSTTGNVIAPTLMLGGGQAVGALLSVLLSLLALVGYVATVRQRLTLAELMTPLSLGIILLWPWDPFRFLLPLAPFLIFYVLTGLSVAPRLTRGLRHLAAPKTQPAALTVAVWSLVGLHAVGNLNYAIGAAKVADEREFAEVEALMGWVRQNVPEGQVVASTNPPLAYLQTGRKAISTQEMLYNWETFRRLGVQYLVLTGRFDVPAEDNAGNKFRVAYRSRLNRHVRVVDLGPPELRKEWPVTPETKIRLLQ
jgi:hypothetical protein